MQQTLYFILSAALIVAGMAGAVVPAMPGVPLVFAGMWLAASTDRYQHVGVVTLSVLGVLAALAMLIDFVAGLLGARRVGAAAWPCGAQVSVRWLACSSAWPACCAAPSPAQSSAKCCGRQSGESKQKSELPPGLALLFGTLAKLALCCTMLGVFLLAFVFG